MKTSISKYTAQKIERLLNYLLAEDEEDFDKGWILYTSDYDTYMPTIVRGLDGTPHWRTYKFWCASGIEEETKFDCTCHSWMIAIEDED